MIQLAPRTRKVKTNLNMPEDVKTKAMKLIKPLGISLSQYVTKLVQADLESRSKSP
jgi:hypothetical protein